MGGDDLIEEVALEEVLGGEGLDVVLAEFSEEGWVFVGEDECGGVEAVGDAVLGGALFALLGFGTGGEERVGAVGG
jgi:hypothetical protein